MNKPKEKTYRIILNRAAEIIKGYKGRSLELLSINQPTDIQFGVYLAKIVSKLSPILGNAIEYQLASYLNSEEDWGRGRWVKQDPGFPDLILEGSGDPVPGIEVKTWFPLSTEITARFRESVTLFPRDQTKIVMLAWVPEYIVYGNPYIVDIWIDSARNVAKARDKHYHDPPDYLVIEPEDTSERTRNLQQTNANGYKFQGSAAELEKAEKEIATWPYKGRYSKASKHSQDLVKALRGKYAYRLDTNFAKMDRIRYQPLEDFKEKVLETKLGNLIIKEWAEIFKKPEKPENAKIIGGLISGEGLF